MAFLSEGLRESITVNKRKKRSEGPASNLARSRVQLYSPDEIENRCSIPAATHMIEMYK